MSTAHRRMMMGSMGQVSGGLWQDIFLRNAGWDDFVVPNGISESEITSLRDPWVYQGASSTQGRLLVPTSQEAPAPYTISGDNVYVLLAKENIIFLDVQAPMVVGSTYRVSVWAAQRIDYTIDQDFSIFINNGTNINQESVFTVSSDLFSPTRTEWNQYSFEYTVGTGEDTENMVVGFHKSGTQNTEENQILFDSVTLEVLT